MSVSERVQSMSIPAEEAEAPLTLPQMIEKANTGGDADLLLLDA